VAKSSSAGEAARPSRRSKHQLYAVKRRGTDDTSVQHPHDATGAADLIGNDFPVPRLGVGRSLDTIDLADNRGEIDAERAGIHLAGRDSHHAVRIPRLGPGKVLLKVGVTILVSILNGIGPFSGIKTPSSMWAAPSDGTLTTSRTPRLGGTIKGPAEPRICRLDWYPGDCDGSNREKRSKIPSVIVTFRGVARATGTPG